MKKPDNYAETLFVFYSCFQMGMSAHKEIKRGLLVENPSNQQRILFEPFVKIEQITRADAGSVVEITAVPRALIGDEEGTSYTYDSAGRYSVAN